jgi:hypothetical protein
VATRAAGAECDSAGEVIPLRISFPTGAGHRLPFSFKGFDVDPIFTLTGFHLIPGVSDYVKVFLTHRTYGTGYRVDPKKVYLDNVPFKGIGDLSEFIGSPMGGRCHGHAVDVDASTLVGGTDSDDVVCGSIYFRIKAD